MGKLVKPSPCMVYEEKFGPIVVVLNYFLLPYFPTYMYLYPVTDPSPSPSPNIGRNTEGAVIELSVGLPLGFLLIAAVLVAIVVIIVLRIHMLRKKKMPTIPVDIYETLERPQVPQSSKPEHKVGGSPQLPPHMDTITTDVNVAYASSIEIHSNAS